MDEQLTAEAINVYYKSVCEAYRLGNVESSYNAPIITLLTQFECAARDLSGERRGQTGENIDIKLWHSEEEVTETEPFAGVEVKKVGGIDRRALSQIKTEADRYGNAILTDNLEWRFWRAGDAEMYTGVRLIEVVDGKLVLKEENTELFISLVEEMKVMVNCSPNASIASPTLLNMRQDIAGSSEEKCLYDAYSFGLIPLFCSIKGKEYGNKKALQKNA